MASNDAYDQQQQQEGAKSFYKTAPGQTYSETGTSAISGLFFYSFLMFTLPLIVFFGLQQVW